MKHLIFDTETTDLIQNSGQPLAKQPHIIELSALLIEDDGTVLGELDFLCKPPIQISDTITKITGLTNADLKDQKTFKDYAQAVHDFFIKADVVVAHNLHYDFSMVNFEVDRLQRSKNFWPPIKICTVEATEHLCGYRLSLTKLHEYLFKAPFEGAHRAKQDVAALAKCYVELIKIGVV